MATFYLFMFFICAYNSWFFYNDSDDDSNWIVLYFLLSLISAAYFINQYIQTLIK